MFGHGFDSRRLHNPVYRCLDLRLKKFRGQTGLFRFIKINIFDTTSEPNMRINVIMPAYLGDYPNAATNRIDKFNRAIYSFLQQSYPNKRLFIISDNCRHTDDAIKKLKRSWNLPFKFLDHPNITTYTLHKKSEMFAGATRNMGLSLARLQKYDHDVACYLDTDDTLLPDHLFRIAQAFQDTKTDWAYFDDLVATNTSLNFRVRSNELTFGRIGTSAIAHKLSCDVKWQDGYGHDWAFIQDLFAKYPNYKIAGVSGYVVCHIPKQIDF